MIDAHQIDKSWTLFLDRDGVINKRPLNDYVKSPATFEFLPGVIEAIRDFSNKFYKIVVITNQQGIGKKIMTEEDLAEVNEFMRAQIEKHHGRIDAIFHCPDLSTKPDNCRKPGLTMAEKARSMFADIVFKKSIMVGDTISDMEFGRKAGMLNIYINSNIETLDPKLVDYEFPDLLSFARWLSAND